MAKKRSSTPRRKPRDAREKLSRAAGGRRASTKQQSATIDQAVWLADGVLLLVGHSGSGVVPTLALAINGTRETLTHQAIRIDDASSNGHGPRSLAIVRVPSASPRDDAARLDFVGGGNAKHRIRAVAALDHSSSPADVAALAQRVLAGLNTATRARILEMLSGASSIPDADALPRAAQVQLSRSLHTIREAIRERQPALVVVAEHHVGMSVEAIARVDDRSFYARGWARDAEGPIRGIVAVSPEGERVQLSEALVARCPRGDVDAWDAGVMGAGVATPGGCGFVVFFRTALPSRLTDGWVFELHDSAGAASELDAPAVESDPLAVRNLILEDLTESRLADEHPAALRACAALERWQAAHAGDAEISRVDEYGRSPDSPEVSIVVPLFQRPDLLEQQLAQFVHDEDLRRAAELIYVLDSPQLEDALRHSAILLHRLYGLPFRTATLRGGRSFAAAVNAGASLARGRLIAMLHSDTLPARPGWLAPLARFHDAREGDVGAVGPRLLYEDDSIEHAGVQFARPAGARSWEVVRRLKGFPRRAAQAAQPAAVPAVSGACLIVARDRFASVGGMSIDYLHGGHADLDFCLRLADAGRQNYYAPDAELYHLEGQSWIDPMRPAMMRFNRWQLGRRWERRIAELMAQVDPAADRGAEVRRCRSSK